MGTQIPIIFHNIYNSHRWMALAAACLIAAICLQAGLVKAEGLVALERQGYPMAFQNGHRLVTIRHRPEKVLVFGLGPAELLIELGLSQLLVGRSDLDKSLAPHPKYAKAWASIPDWSADELPAEEAKNDGPDFVYGRLDPKAPEMSRGFLTVYASTAGDMREFIREVEDLAAIFNIRPQAGAFLADLEARLTALGRRIAAREPVRVMVVKGLEDGRLATVGGSDFASEVLKLGGALNVFNDMGRSPEPTSAEAAKRAPGFIVIVNDGSHSSTDTLDRLRGDPILSTLEAVANDRILTIDETWLSPGPRLAEAAELLARTLHPQAME